VPPFLAAAAPAKEAGGPHAAPSEGLPRSPRGETPNRIAKHAFGFYPGAMTFNPFIVEKGRFC